MKNKEIEELLNKLEYASECDDFIIEIRKDRAKLLLSYIEQLKKQAELGEHYKHLYSEVKKQKDDVVKYCNKTIESLNWKKRDIMQILTPENGYLKADIEIEIRKYEDLLRMLGEIE